MKYKKMVKTYNILMYLISLSKQYLYTVALNSVVSNIYI